PATTAPTTLSLHDALPISGGPQFYQRTDGSGVAAAKRKQSADYRPERRTHFESPGHRAGLAGGAVSARRRPFFSDRQHSSRLGRSEEHTSELQSPCNLVCR